MGWSTSATPVQVQLTMKKWKSQFSSISISIKLSDAIDVRSLINSKYVLNNTTKQSLAYFTSFRSKSVPRTKNNGQKWWKIFLVHSIRRDKLLVYTNIMSIDALYYYNECIKHSGWLNSYSCSSRGCQVRWIITLIKYNPNKLYWSDSNHPVTCACVNDWFGCLLYWYNLFNC